MITATNLLLRGCAETGWITVADVGDALHPTPKGYDFLTVAVAPLIDLQLATRRVTPRDRHSPRIGLCRFASPLPTWRPRPALVGVQTRRDETGAGAERDGS